MSRPSRNLLWSELACHDGSRTPYPMKWRKSRLPKLVRVFEDIRRHVGGPVTLNCAYRSPDHNRRIGGTKHSQHIEGRAIDLRVPVTMSTSEFHTLIRKIVQSNMLIGGVGYYSWGVHVDTRDRINGNVVRWGSTKSLPRV